MNLLDITTKQWDAQCLHVCGVELGEKLGRPVSSEMCVGVVSSYMVERFDFRPDCRVVAFTGDNPSSVAGLGLQRDYLAISLGTSDTVFLWLDQPTPALEGHVFCNPVDSSAFMALLCFKNGSMTRESVRDRYSSRSWDQFDAQLACLPPGNNGFLAMHFNEEEITPRGVHGIYRFDSSDQPLQCFDDAAIEVRALIEGQCLARRVHAQRLGLHLESTTKIVVTGGASNNRALLQVLSDVFNAETLIQETPDAAALGAAYRAAHGLHVTLEPEAKSNSFNHFLQQRRPPTFKLLCRPCAKAVKVYNAMAVRYAALEHTILTAQTLPPLHPTSSNS